jgi:Family of unknown function (DUF6152)
MGMKKRGFVFGSLMVLCVVVPMLAHHSPAVFDRTKEVKLVGVVKEFRWSNPHSFIELDVRNEKGETDRWAVEMNPPSYLVKAGWKSSTIKPGDTVTILVNPLRTSEKVGKFISITLASGQVLGENPPSEAK